MLRPETGKASRFLQGKQLEKMDSEPVSKPLSIAPWLLAAWPLSPLAHPHPLPQPLSTQTSSPWNQNVLRCLIPALWPCCPLCIKGFPPLLCLANSYLALKTNLWTTSLQKGYMSWDAVLFLEKEKVQPFSSIRLLSTLPPHRTVSILGAKTLLFMSGSLAAMSAA